MRTTTTGKSVVSFTIAVQKRIKPTNGDPDADFFRVTAWGQTAEFVNNYLTKGRLISIDGRLESRKFTDKDGNNREVVEIVADNVSGLDKHKSNETIRRKHSSPRISGAFWYKCLRFLVTV